MGLEVPNINPGAEPGILIADIGGTNTRLAMGADLIKYTTNRTRRDLDDAIDDIAMRSIIVMNGRSPDLVGVSIAGEVSGDQETIVRAGALNDYGWTKQPIKQELANALDVDSESVLIINDAESAGLGEREADRRKGLLVPGFQGLIETVSSGNGGAVYDINGAKNVEPGHIDSGKEAPVACGCGAGNTCIEAHIGGESVKNHIGTGLENVPHSSNFWLEYKSKFRQLQLVKLDVLRERGFDPQKWSFFGSVALKGPRIVEDFGGFLADREPGIQVVRAHYGDESGLYGVYFAAKEKALDAV